MTIYKIVFSKWIFVYFVFILNWLVSGCLKSSSYLVKNHFFMSNMFLFLKKNLLWFFFLLTGLICNGGVHTAATYSRANLCSTVWALKKNLKNKDQMCRFNSHNSWSLFSVLFGKCSKVEFVNLPLTSAVVNQSSQNICWLYLLTQNEPSLFGKALLTVYLR